MLIWVPRPSPECVSQVIQRGEFQLCLDEFKEGYELSNESPVSGEALLTFHASSWVLFCLMGRPLTMPWEGPATVSTGQVWPEEPRQVFVQDVVSKWGALSSAGVVANGTGLSFGPAPLPLFLLSYFDEFRWDHHSTPVPHSSMAGLVWGVEGLCCVVWLRGTVTPVRSRVGLVGPRCFWFSEIAIIPNPRTFNFKIPHHSYS